jgi:hypothetical protein
MLSRGIVCVFRWDERKSGGEVIWRLDAYHMGEGWRRGEVEITRQAKVAGVWVLFEMRVELMQGTRRGWTMGVAERSSGSFNVQVMVLTSESTM